MEAEAALLQKRSKFGGEWRMPQKSPILAIVGWCVILLLVSGVMTVGATSVARAASTGATDTAEDGVRAEIALLLEEYAARLKGKDAVAIAEMYSYPYKTVHPDGEAKVFATKEELLGFLAEAHAGIDEFEAIEVDVRELVYSGDTAVAKAATFVTVVLEGQPATFISEVEFRFVRSGGRWLISEEWTLATEVSAR